MPMRLLLSRVGSAGLLAAAVAFLVVRGQEFVAAQPPPPPGVAKDKAKDKKDIPPEDFDSPFGFPYERDAKKQLEAARAYLDFKEVPWNTVCPLLQNILDSKSDSFFNVKYQVGGRTEVNRISVRTEANRIIAAFPKEGLEFYQQAYGQTAAGLLGEAAKANYDPARLSEVSQRYFHTKAGGEATALLGTLHLDRGNYLEAASSFERLLARPNTDPLLTPRTLFRAALALKRSGDPRHAAPAKTAAEKLLLAVARDGLKVGRRTYTADQVKAELDRPAGRSRVDSLVSEWTGRYGNAARNGTVAGGPPFLVPAFEPCPMVDPNLDPGPAGSDSRTGLAATEWIKAELNRQFGGNPPPSAVPLPGFFPVTAPDVVIYRGYGAVYAVASRDHVHLGKPVAAGDVRWIARTHFGAHQLLTPGYFYHEDATVPTQVRGWWATYTATKADSILYENPQLGALAHDGTAAYYLDDVAIPPPPVAYDPNFGGFPGGMPPGFARQGGVLAGAVRAGELYAVDLNTGHLLWTLGRFEAEKKDLVNPAQVAPPATEDDADKLSSAFHLCLNAVFLGPPLPLNGRLYVLVEQAGAIRLLCLDPKNLAEVKYLDKIEKTREENGIQVTRKEVGEVVLRVPSLVWQQKLGRPANPFPGDSVRRFQGAFLAAGDGILVCPTNSGAVIAVDAMSRSLLWAHAYRKLEATDTPGGGQMMGGRRGGMRFNPDGSPQLVQQLATNRWRAAAPVVAGGRVVVAAYDSNRLECLDLRTGKVVWAVDRKPNDLYVGGVVDDKVVVVGKDEVRAYPLNAEPGAVTPAWTTALAGTPTGHGVAGKGVYYLPVRPPGAGKDGAPAAEIVALDAAAGKIVSKTAARNRTADPSGSTLALFGLGNLVYQDGLVVAQSAWEVAVYPQLEVKRAEMDRRLAANPKDPAGLTDRGELLLDEGKVKEAVADLREAGRHDPPEAVRRRLRDKLYAAYAELTRQDFAAAEPYLAEYAALCEVPSDSDDPAERKRREDQTVRRKQHYLYLLAKGREGQGRLADSFDACLALAGLGDGADLIELPDEPGTKTRGDVWARGRIDGMIRRAADPAARKALEDRVNKEWEAVRAVGDVARLKDFVAVFGPYFPAGAAAGLALAERLLADGSEGAGREAQVHLGALRATAADPAVRARATDLLAAVMAKNGLLEDAVGLYQQLGREYADVVVRDGKTGADLLADRLTDKRLLPYLEPARYPVPARVKVEDRRDSGALIQTGFDVEPDGELFPAYRRLRFTFDTTQAGNGTWTLRAVDRVTGAERCRFPDLVPPPTHNGSFTSARLVQGSGHLLLVHLGQWVYCLDLAEKRRRWEENLLGPSAPANQQPTIDVRDPDEVAVNYTEGVKVTIGRAAVLQPGYVAVLTRDGLRAFEPTTKRELWSRKGLPDRCHLYGDARHLVLVERGADTRPVGVKVLRAVDGQPVDGAPDLGKDLGRATSYRVVGKDAVLAEPAKDGRRVLRRVDLTTGAETWRREFPAGSVPVRSADPAWAGYLTPDGKIEVVSAATGKTAATLPIDPDKVATHVKQAAEVKLLADHDRFYAALDRAAGAGGGGVAGRLQQQPYALRSLAVNGPVYCFDRASGARLWYVDGLFDHQRLLVERFADLPVLVAAAPVFDKAGGMAYKVVVVEKDRGMIRYNKGSAGDTNPFMALNIDPKAGTVDLAKYNFRLRVGPEDGPAAR